MVKSGQSAQSRHTLPGLPGVYVRLFCDLLRELGYDDVALLRAAGLERSALLHPDSRVSMEKAIAITQRGLVLAENEGLGFRYAAALKVTLHGSVGLLAASCLTAREVLDATTRYIGLRAPFLEFSWKPDGDALMLEVRALWDLGKHRAFIMEVMLMGIVHTIRQLGPGEPDEVEVWMEGPAPPYYERLSQRLPAPVRYDMPSCVVRTSATLLERRPWLADPSIAALAREDCEAELVRLFAPEPSVAAAVGRLLGRREVGTPTLEETAKALHVSSRTLKRRLKDEGLTYRALVDAELRARSLRLLTETNLHLGEIAHRAGYNDISNFSRAFRRWTGKSPSSFRQKR